MLTRFVLHTIWRNKGIALAALAYYLFSQVKKKQSENGATMQPASGGGRSSHRRR